MSSETPQPPPQQPPYAAPYGQPYEQPQPPYPAYPPPRKGMPGWVWVLLGCGCLGFVVIPAILAAILFPVFSQAREAARSASCMSNEKQMSLGLLMYAQDYDQKLPPSTQWMALESPYIKNDSVYHCPSLHADGPTAYGYAMYSPLSGTLTTDVANPQQVPLLFDSSNLAYNATDTGTSFANPPRHRGSNNVAYLDGHAVRTLNLNGGRAPGASF